MKYDELIKDLRICASTFCESCEKCSHSNEHGDCYNGLKRSAADAIEELQSQLPKWIPVTERLPDYDKAVLCHCRANIIETLCLENDGHWYGYSGRYMKGFVTHWMPLPEPPKEETDG